MTTNPHEPAANQASAARKVSVPSADSKPLTAEQKAEMMRKEAQDSRTIIEFLRKQHQERMAAERRTGGQF